MIIWIPRWIFITEELLLVTSYNAQGSTFTFKNNEYRRSDVRDIVGEDINIGDKAYVFKKIGA